MDDLRWLLLLFGLLIVVGVYIYSRQSSTTVRNPHADKAPQPKVEPAIQAGNVADTESSDDDEHAEPEVALQKIVTLRLVARHQGAFSGDELVLNLRGIGMKHGKFGIFHRFEGTDEKKSVFCAASLVEPGSFDLENLKDQRIPGISLFMVLPGPVEGAQAFDSMVVAGRTLSKSLDGDLLDESGSTLSIQRERYLREEIIQFQHEISVA